MTKVAAFELLLPDGTHLTATITAEREGRSYVARCVRTDPGPKGRAKSWTFKRETLTEAESAQAAWVQIQKASR